MTTMTASRTRHLVTGLGVGALHGYEIFAIGWTMRRLRLGPLSGSSLAKPYEASSYLATIAHREVIERCAKSGWKTLRRLNASRD